MAQSNDKIIKNLIEQVFDLKRIVFQLSNEIIELRNQEVKK